MAGAADTGGGSAQRGLRGPPAASRSLHVRPPRIALGLGTIALLSHWVLWGDGAPWGRSVPGGLLLLGAGLTWMLWAWWCLRRAGTSIVPTDTPTRLVDDGPFAFGRNPMYLGMSCALLGFSIALGSPFGAAAALLFAVIVQRVHIPHEEAQLRCAFGGWYSDYAATVRRWL